MKNLKAALLHNNLHQNPRKETNKKKKISKRWRINRLES